MAKYSAYREKVEQVLEMVPSANSIVLLELSAHVWKAGDFFEGRGWEGWLPESEQCYWKCYQLCQ